MTATLAILHPGEMGAAVGACAHARGAHVLWVSEGRSEATCRRAVEAGLTDVRTLGTALRASDVVLSVCPPHGAVELARAVAALGFRGLFVDANAVSPDTSREIGRIVEGGGATFVDGGIVGPPPGPNASSRLYVSGIGAERIAALFAGSFVQVLTLGSAIGAASALKACYAAWNKGATALVAAVRAVAVHEGVDAALVEAWRDSQPDALKRSEIVRTSARKAWRWIAEMEEIAATFASAGVPDGFQRAAAEIYRRLACYKDASAPPPLDELLRDLSAANGRR